MKERAAAPWLRTFLIIFSGQAFSLLGSSAVNFALIWWLTAKTGSPSILAYAAVAGLLPQAVVGPFAGPFVDRWDRRATMIMADLLIAATSVVLIALFVAGVPSITSIIVMLAARSVGAAFHTPASQAAVPMYVPQDQLMRVAGWNFFLGSGVAMAGPVLGAFLMGVAPMTAVVGLDIAGALIAVASLLLVTIPHPERPPGELEVRGVMAELAEGWRELLRHRGLFWLTIMITVVTLLYMPLNALFPLMTFAHFGGDVFDAGIIELAFGAGMLAGSLALGLLAKRLSAVGMGAAGIMLVGLMLTGSGLLPSSGFWVFAALCVVMGVSVPLFAAPITALFQSLVEPSKLGRVMSLYTTMAMAVAPPGLLLAGPLAERTGVALWFVLSGALIFLAGVVVRVLPGLRDLDRAVPPTRGDAVPSADSGAILPAQGDAVPPVETEV